MTPPSVLIIGSGIIGAGFAYAAAQRSLPTRVISSLPVNSGGTATANSWAWINANTDNDRSYFDLRHASMQLWQRWMQMVPDLVASSSGGFVWDMDPETLRAFAACHEEWGYPVELLTANVIAAKLPCLREVPALAAYVPTEMAIEPGDAVSALLAAGAIEPEQRHVHSLMIDPDRVYGVMTDDGPCTADEIILASGNGTPALLESVGAAIEMTPTTGLLVKTQPLPKFLPHLLTAPDYHVRQTCTGQLLIGGTFNHHQAPDDGRSQQDAATVLAARVECALHCPAPLEVASFSLGQRVIPKGGRPRIGRIQRSDGREIAGLYLAVMHSGISNAAAVADHGMAEIATGAPSLLLTPFRPGSGVAQESGSRTG
jgi:glycine/D-amino acid oxidase-like deaminating enzyme